MQDDLGQSKIVASLRTSWLGIPVYYYPSIRSTNDTLAEMANRGEPSGAMVIAEYQSQGKGRLGRRWTAPRGSSLLTSLLFRPDWSSEQVPWLAMIAGLAAVKAIESNTDLLVRLKWPNDIMVSRNGKWHKTGGLLYEGKLDKHQLSWAVLGTGINVNIDQDSMPDTQIPATSLMIETKSTVSRLGLLISYLDYLESIYDKVSRGYSPHEEWNEHLITLGRKVLISNQGRTESFTGIAEGTDEWGRLLVRDTSGAVHYLSAGDVTLSG